MKLVFIDRVKEEKDDLHSNSSNSNSAFSGRITGTGNYNPTDEPTSKFAFLTTIKNQSMKLAAAVKGEKDKDFDPNVHWSESNFTNVRMSNLRGPLTTNDVQNTPTVSSRVSAPGTPGGSWGSSSYVPPSFDPPATPADELPSFHSPYSFSNPASDAFETSDYQPPSFLSGLSPFSFLLFLSTHSLSQIKLPNPRLSSK